MLLLLWGQLAAGWVLNLLSLLAKSSEATRNKSDSFLPPPRLVFSLTRLVFSLHVVVLMAVVSVRRW